MDIRNIAIIAHVDHGKTTLTDALLRQSGEFEEGSSMDSNALERERGITIYAKNSSLSYKGTKINIVDTPGHADFGSEVERVLRAIDSVILVVDAQEGPMPQTRFVLRKSLELGLKPIVVINKIDKQGSDPAWVHDEVFGLFLELGATDEQADFKTVYAIGREGKAGLSPKEEMKDLTPLLETILLNVPPATGAKDAPLRASVFNLAYDSFLGRMGLSRIVDGSIKMGDTVFAINPSGKKIKGRVSKIFSFKGVNKEEAEVGVTGDIVLIAGIPDIYIGDTIALAEDAEALPAIAVDEPTITLRFLVNNSPFAGREGKFVTSRQIRERLERELEVNVGLRVDFSGNDFFVVSGRGELHIAILLETMRREGYELQVSEPEVIKKEIDGVIHEPFEEVIADVRSEMQGTVIEKLGKRAAILKDLKNHGGLVRLIFEGPTRGLLGYRSEFLIDTKGEGIFSSRVIGFRPFAGVIERRAAGSMISMATGKAIAFSLGNLQERGTLYVGAGTEVYEGMIIGGTSKGDEMSVNPTKGKQLTNVRSSGNDDAIMLTPHREISIERGLEIMASDEYLEITPKSVRLRKEHLTETARSKASRKS